MSEQLPLIEMPALPRLTGRQELALAALEHARDDGLTADEVGAILHASRSVHGTDERCVWCGSSGREVLLALKAKGLVRYRGRLKVWQACAAAQETREPARPVTESEALEEFGF